MMLPWHTAIAYALTGQLFAELETQPVPDPAETLRLLAERGWDRDTIATLAQQHQGVWPQPIPEEVREDLGPAQLVAAVQQAVGLLRLEGVSAHPVSRPLNADERRLLQDRPPHWDR